MNQSFGKKYKLCSKKIIDLVYRTGKEIKAFPFYLKYTEDEFCETPFQIVIVVPKKKFRQATTRNQIRRYIREAIRLEKPQLENYLIGHSKSLALFLIYSGPAEINLGTAKNQITKLLNKLIDTLETK